MFLKANPIWYFRTVIEIGLQGGPKKTGPFLIGDNFAAVNGRKACDMSKVCKFYLEKCIKLACLCV